MPKFPIARIPQNSPSHHDAASCLNHEAHLAHAMAILNRGQEAMGTCRRAEDLFRGEERIEHLQTHSSFFEKHGVKTWLKHGGLQGSVFSPSFHRARDFFFEPFLVSNCHYVKCSTAVL